VFLNMPNLERNAQLLPAQDEGCTANLEAYPDGTTSDGGRVIGRCDGQHCLLFLAQEAGLFTASNLNSSNTSFRLAFVGRIEAVYARDEKNRPLDYAGYRIVRRGCRKCDKYSTNSTEMNHGIGKYSVEKKVGEKVAITHPRVQDSNFRINLEDALG